MKLLLSAWFGFMASASFWLPAYKGDLGGDAVNLVPLYLLVGGLAAFGLRERASSAREALLSTVPNAGILAAAALAGYLLNEAGADYRGGPLYLYFGVALLASWAALMESTALVSRTRWNGPMGIGVGLFVAGLGFLMFTIRID